MSDERAPDATQGISTAYRDAALARSRLEEGGESRMARKLEEAAMAGATYAGTGLAGALGGIGRASLLTADDRRAVQLVDELRARGVTSFEGLGIKVTF